jgi:hypothetical protein
VSAALRGLRCACEQVDDWPLAPVLSTERLLLEPLRVEHAEEMAPLLDDRRLHAFTGGEFRRRWRSC